MGFPFFHFTFMRLLFSLSQLPLILVHSSSFMQPLCHDGESSALLQFKQSFTIDKSASRDPSASSKVASWKQEGDSTDCCSWDGVECHEHTGHVIGLDLSSSCLFGSINSNSSLFRLVRLRSLNLADNDFNYSQIPCQVRKFSRLTYLNLSGSAFSGQIPIEVSQLPHLSSLDFNYNANLELKKPSLTNLLGNSTRLQHLHLGGVNISSAVPNILANFSSLTFLALDNCGLRGEFPVGIFRLPNLRVLDVGNNEYLTGFLPHFTWSSPLNTLNLYATSFSGPIPSSIGNLTQLSHLDLSSNQLTGPIPSSIGNLVQLCFLNLKSNQLTGSIPSSVENLTQLRRLEISSNDLFVEFHLFLKLRNLIFLFLSDNQVSSLVKEPMTNVTLPKYRSLGLSSCNLSKFPNFLRSQDELRYLDLSRNNIHGQIPEWMWNISKVSLRTIDLSKNSLTGFGQHPPLLPWTNLAILDFSSNFLQGSLPIPPLSTIYYKISNNSLTGSIPESICNLSSLEVFALSYNNLSGSLPRCLPNFGDFLLVLDFRRNKFEGSIPETWTKGSQLGVIIFSENKFQGRIPRSLAKCTMLEILDLGNNQFGDIFPSWLGNLPNLFVLNLRSNRFNGSIGTSKAEYKFPNLQIIDLSHNFFVGQLPLQLFGNWNAAKFDSANRITYIHANDSPVTTCNYSMTMTNKGINMFYEKVQESFTAIDFSSNRFVGEIPQSIGNLKGLRLLNISNNVLTGHIPPSLGNIEELEALDLSQNQLSGEIPQQLTQLTFLAFFNVSQNNLLGPIPQGKQFGTFSNTSFEGNPELCGKQLTKKCEDVEALPPPPSIFVENQDSGSLFEFGWKIVLIGYGFGVVVGVTIEHIVTARKHDWLMKTFRIRHVVSRKLSGRGRRN